MSRRYCPVGWAGKVELSFLHPTAGFPINQHGRMVYTDKVPTSLGDLPRDTQAQIRRLASDIQQNGMKHPLLISAQGWIFDGHRRYFAAKEAGLPKVPVKCIARSLPGSWAELSQLEGRMAQERAGVAR